ncbi:cation:proton antiporter [Candidatus Pacearchaeota archaeon]|nr:cation:proton antiporter [Candidatus Pacearchaeota archaeon]
MEEIFINLSLILAVAVAVSAIARLLKQPLLIGYIFSGILVGPYFLNLLSESATLGTFSQIGVALLLFTVGLHLNPKVIKEVGKISLITGIGQVLFTSIIGFLISISLGFSLVSSIYISIALTFSSTIIIMKLITDKGDLETVYGKISIGFLIVQDLIAVFILMIVSSSSGGINFSNFLFETLLYGGLSIFGLVLVSWKLLPLVLNKVAKSQEFLFLFSIGWCLLLASWFSFLNFSLEIGALLAGIALSTTPYSNEISSKMRPLRDFFIVLFFMIIGSQMVISDVANNIGPIIIFSLFILIGNPLIVLILMGSMGYTKRNGFFAGLTVAQISEFSIILISLGVVVGHLTPEILSLVTVVGLITIAGSTYMITYSNWIYSKIYRRLKIFEKKHVRESRDIKKTYDAILFGYNRIGFSILNSLKSAKKKYLVVDFNPETIKNLNKFKVPALYGDVYDLELLEELPFENLDLAISTIPELETNELLIKAIKEKNKKTVIILRAQTIEDALKLYNAGANYVLTPHFLGGEYVAKMIKQVKAGDENYYQEKNKHIKMLKQIREKGSYKYADL